MLRPVLRGWIAAVLLAASAVQAAHAQSPIWTSGWTISGPPNFRLADTSPAFAVAADGDVVLAAPSSAMSDFQVIRIAPTGAALRWAINLGGNASAGDGRINGLLATTDGGAIVAFGGQVAKVAGNGTLAWSRAIPQSSFLTADSGAIVTAGCNWPDTTGIVSALDSDTGTIVWQRAFGGSQQCKLGGAVRDVAGNVYVTLLEYQNNTSVVSYTVLVKLDAAGETVWTVLASKTGLASLIGADADRVFASTNVDVRGFASADGSAQWTTPIASSGAVAFVAQDSSVEPVIEADGTITRLAGDTGAARWTVSGSGLHVVDETILMAGLVRLDPATGASLWTADVSNTDGEGNSLSSYSFKKGGVLGLIASARTNAFGSPAPYLQAIDVLTGGAGDAIQIPPVAQGIGEPISSGWGYSVADDSGHVLSVAVAEGIAGPEIRLRQQSAVDGAVMWEVSEPALLLPVEYFWGYTPSQPSLSWTDAAVVVACAENYNSGGTYAGTAWVAAFNRLTGQQLWSTQLVDAYQQGTAVTMPVVAGDGSIFLATGASFATPEPPYGYIHNYGQVSVYKLSAVDGHTLWRRDAPGPYGSYYAITPALIGVGVDALVGGAFESQPAASTLVRLAGSNGATLWASSLFPADGVSTIHDAGSGSLVVTGDGWAKVDASTGATAWQDSWPGDPSCAASPGCSLSDGPMLPAGDLLSFGFAHYTPWLVRYRGDGSGIVDSWQPESVVPTLRSYIGSAAVDSGGQIWVRLGRYMPNPSLGLTFLARFDPGTGAFASQQAVGSFDGDLFTVTNSPELIAAPKNNRLLIDTFDVNLSQPASLGDALLDTTILATGDLTAQVSLTASEVMPGQETAFHLTVDYTGDQPVAGVTLTARLGWSSDPTQVVCTPQGGSNCIVHTEAGGVRASFDIQPGGHVDITAHIRVLESTNETPTFRMAVQGPSGLNETETRNNFSSLTIAQSLFIGGFD